MPENIYVDVLARDLARVLPDTSRCVFYMVDRPSTTIIRDICAHLGEPYTACTPDELAVIIAGVKDVTVAIIFSDVINDRLSNLLRELSDQNRHLWIIHAKRCIAADMATGEISKTISFELIESEARVEPADFENHRLAVFEEIKKGIQRETLR